MGTCSKHSQRWLGRCTFREEGLADVQRERQRLDGSGARPDDDALDPEPHEGRQGAEGHVDVGIVCARLFDHAAQLGVAISTEHGEDAADGPDDERQVNGPENGQERTVDIIFTPL